MATTDVDLGYVAGHLNLDQPVLNSFAAAPTVELVATVLQAIANKAHEFDTLYSEKLRTDIELENAVRSAEGRTQSSKATVDKALKDLEEARHNSNEQESRRQAVENELSALKTQQLDHEAEVTALKNKIETLQSSNRTSLSIIESNNKRDQTVTEELTKLHQKNVELGRELTSLQQSEQNVKGQLNGAKYREDSLKQQLDLARRNVEWFENELKTKNEEALKYRKEKGARIAELQQQNEDARSQVDSLKRSDQQLRDRLEKLQTKADGFLVKLQKQEGNFAATVDSYKQELEDQRRLVEMSEQLCRKHHERVRELEAERERLKDNYENEVRRVRLDLERERQTTTDMEDKLRQVESEVDELRARLDHAPPPAASVPQTPRQNGSLAGRAPSPFGTPGSIRSKSAVTATQAIEQLYQVKGQLASEKRRSQQLSEELDNMMTALEAKAPEMQELQAESTMLQDEIARMSESLQQSLEERDIAKRAARKAEGGLSTAHAETRILRTQLRDLGTQIQMLVFNIYAIEKGTENLTEDEKYRIQQLAKGEISEEALTGLSDTHEFITQKLLVFRDIQSLQAKNEELMRITRELADQLESEEALAAKHQAKEDHDQVEKLQDEQIHLTEELKSYRNTMQSYKTERDMFRRLLQQRGVGGDESSMMRHSLDGSGRLPLSSIEGGDQAESVNEALRKLQTEFDDFRDAQEGVRKDFREQIDRLHKERNTLQTESVKLSGEVRLETERREMLQANYTALQNENLELQKRSQSLSETAAKQDIRTQQVAEELIEARGLLDSMRNETANLKAEKVLWKDIQDRMSRDNETLIEEKTRLNTLIATQQSLENEHNLSEAETRRKMQAKVESLEQELTGTQRRLTQETEESKKLQLRKEYESKEAQKRIDELTANLGHVREEYSGVKTSRDHLQHRVDELIVEVRNAEERVGRLQPRPTPRPVAQVSGNDEQHDADIQELDVEIMDLKRDLDMSRTQLENARAQVEQYRELSQANEEALEDLQSSQSQYREEMEALVEEKEARIKELNQRVEDMLEELSRSNSELSTLRDSQGEVSRKHEDEKAILEEEIKRLKDDSARHVEAARYHQQDLRAQAEIASKAQQDYEKELVKHAEAAKLVQQMRSEHNQMKGEAATLRAEAESVKVTLAQSESSWEDRRRQLEQEVAELKARREDSNAQNKLLHQQLEGLTAQVAAVQQKRGGSEEAFALGEGEVIAADVAEGLRELNSYLRREKEILEVQYDMKTHEAKRLQQQVDYVQSQLDETRLKLDQERTSASQGGRTSMAHQDLMEKLNELNLYRESSMALRNENQQLKTRLAEKSKATEEAEAKLHPVEAEIETLKTQIGFLEDEIKQIQADRDRWQKRTEGILTKYGRVDPAEIEQLKETIANLEKERDAIKAAQGPMDAKVTELESTLEQERSSWQTTRSKITEQFKERSKRLTNEKNEALQQSKELQEQMDQVNRDLAAANKKTDELGRTNTDLEQQIHNFKQQVEQLRQQSDSSHTQVERTDQVDAAHEGSANAEALATLQRRMITAQEELESVKTQRDSAERQLEQLRAELQQIIGERDSVKKQLEDRAQGSETTAATAVVAATPQAQRLPAASDEEKIALEHKLKAAETKAAEFEKKASDVEAKINQTLKDRSDRMKDNLNNKLKERRAKMEEEFKQKEKDFDLRLEQEKRIWQAENATSHPPPEAVATTTTATPKTEPVPQTSPDPSQLDDAGVRQFLQNNATVKSIVAGNIKKRLEAETARIKAEYDGKITSARDQAQLMESKKSTLRINMAENKLKAANAKLGVVETAAGETPQKPVIEVWDVAKKAQATPATPAVPGAGAATMSPAPRSTPARPGSAAVINTPSSAVAAVVETPGSAAPSQKKSESTEQATGEKTNAQPLNPFATATTDTSNTANPFTSKAPIKGDTDSEAGQQGQQGQQQLQPQPSRSGIPTARGGASRGRGTYTTPAQRAAGGSQPNVPAVRGGRGGGVPRGGRGGFNPNASDFQPGTAGNKRPRGDADAGNGAKRARGAH